jgi:DNA-binding response OmpR family regulator
MAKILIAEDEKAINDLIRINLTLAGYECKQVFDGEEALNMAFENKFDLILLDVMLPKLSGFEIIGELKGTPVIFVTARSTVSDRLKGLKLGADDYIVKPFEMLELIERVKEHNFVPVVDDRGCFIGLILRRDVLSFLLKFYEAEKDKND